MFDDAWINSTLTTVISDIAPPPAPLSQILQRASRSRVAPSKGARRLQPAIGTFAAIVGAIAIGLPLVAPGLVESVETRIAQILKWSPPPVPPPRSLASRLRPHSATLASAQARVPFKIVLPEGLPHDVRLTSIATSPSGVYDKVTRTWQLGSQAVYFTYQRSRGRSFTLLADRFDPRTGPPSRYMYEDTGKVRNGMPVLVRHEKFTWRNGDQVIMATDGTGIRADEIRAIRSAMHGVNIAAAQTSGALDSGTIDKMYPGP